MIGHKRFSKVDELFDAALDRPADERLRFIEQACGEDTDLATEVRKLLALSSDEDSLFPSGAMKGPLWDEVARELQNGSSSTDLAPGAQVGPYEIVELIGRGGMGSVYRARDPGLGRDVAIKALSREFALDGSTMKRFEREAKLLASLNHPNIASIYDFLTVDETRFLILELVEGQTLGERLERGPFDLRELLQVAEQIAGALEEAHRKGVIHRDLKPANVKLTRDGRIKILDFGLAKTHDEADWDASQSSFETSPTTQDGVVLGTPGYMSPEQARGDSVDKRTDVWAFGCLLYEMSTGRRAFTGKTPSDAIAAVLRDEVDLSVLPSSTPSALRQLIRRCLEQDPRNRLQDIGDARLEIADLSRQDSRGLLAPPETKSMGRWIALAALASFLAGMAFYRAIGSRSPLSTDGSVTRTTLALGPEERLWIGASSSLALSPDGSRLAFVGDRSGRIQLYVRALDRYELTPIRGSDGARDPFFSPDGKWIGFFARGEMKKVAVERGVAESITEAGLQSRGASWGENGDIVFAQDGAPGLYSVPEIGGTAQVLTDPGETEGRELLWPQWLPGGRRILFTLRSSLDGRVTDRMAALDLDTKEIVIVGEGAQGVYLPSGHLVYVRADAIEAVAFDPTVLRVEGDPFPLVEDVNAYPVGASTFAVSGAGALVYLPRTQSAELHVVARDGESMRLDLPPGTPGWPRIAPDGRYAAVHIGGRESREVWVLDLERPGSARQLSFQGGGFPVWSPDGSRVAFMSRWGGRGSLYTVAADGSEPPRLLLGGNRTKIPGSWSAKGVLAFYEIGDVTQRDIWVVDVAQEKGPELFVATPANELAPVFSPDGNHLAYVSNETGQNEVYVRPYPPPGPVTAVSIDGGSEPVWSDDGTELYFRHGDKILSVPVETRSGFRVGRPREILVEPSVPGAAGNPAFDVFSDGRRFIMRRAAPDSYIDRLHLVLNWNRELAELVPTP